MKIFVCEQEDGIVCGNVAECDDKMIFLFKKDF